MMRGAWTFVVGIGLTFAGCSSSNSSGPAGDSGAAGDFGDSGAVGGSDSAGGADSAGGSDSAGDSGAAGVSGLAGDSGFAGESGAGGVSGNAPPLPEGTLLYVRHETQDQDVLVALDLETGGERVITDLTGDGSSGWEIDGYSLSPDRRRIALASLYGPTSADTATGLATRAIWTLTTAGTDFRRLTPTVPNQGGGRQGFQYDVGDPEWTADGSHVVYDFGTYWWEGTTFKGGSFPWIVSATGRDVPTTFPTPSDCTVIYPARNPVTGEFLFIHSVCVPGQGDGAGLYLYPADGGTSPTRLIASAHVDGYVDVFLQKAAWLADGSGFLFLGGIAESNWRASLLVYDLDADTISSLVTPPAGAAIYGVTISPDSSKIVYCLRQDEGGFEDLRLIDLDLASPTDVALTTDGKSCDPSF